MSKDKKSCGIFKVDNYPDVSKNEVEIFYKVMTREEAMEMSPPSVHFNTPLVQLKSNKIKLETEDPALLYTIWQILGRLGYSTIDLKEEDGLEL